MAYATEFLEAMKEKKLEGLFINDYFLQDKVLNSMQFNNAAAVNNGGGFSYTVVRNQKVAGAAASRAFNEDYEVVNSNPKPETFYLGTFGGKYKVDLTRDEILGGVLTENEAREKMNAAVNEFAYQLIKGVESGGKGFNGMEAYCGANASEMVHNEFGDLTGVLSEDKAIAFLRWFNEVVGELDVDANALYASRKLSSSLITIQSVLKRYVKEVELGSLNYDTFLAIPIIPIDNSIGLRRTVTDSEDPEIQASVEDIYIARLDVNNGIFCASPANKSEFVKVVKPVQVGSPLATGYVDFATCLVPKNKGALRKATILV